MIGMIGIIPTPRSTTRTLIGPPGRLPATGSPLIPPGTPISLPGSVTGRFGTLTGFPGTLIRLPGTSTGLVNTLTAHVPAAAGLLPGTGRWPVAAGGSGTRGPDTGLLGRTELGGPELGRAEPGVGGFSGGLGGAGMRRCGVGYAGMRETGMRGTQMRDVGLWGPGVFAGVGPGRVEQQDRAMGIAGNAAGLRCPGVSLGWRRFWVEDRRIV
ncbi:hypothetical protein Aple_077480 [Acrocarpospora pleiomorpha]|uniref:Uncharacterized protein n=2 Tax=Acrocarpospora pleiomorpha TaxID=90975 RepID=A0A5M3XXR2_9ACTN|nr:hypothetical protein Aple_077480 [Acrocarpospora pleiomorpha]